MVYLNIAFVEGGISGYNIGIVINEEVTMYTLWVYSGCREINLLGESLLFYSTG